MAKVERLTRHAYINILKQYAKMFGLDPDFVYSNTSFDTIAAILNSEKDTDEYLERYNYIYSELQK